MAQRKLLLQQSVLVILGRIATECFECIVLDRAKIPQREEEILKWACASSLWERAIFVGMVQRNVGLR